MNKNIAVRFTACAAFVFAAELTWDDDGWPHVEGIK